MICECGSKFHYCGGCDSDTAMDNGFCSGTCMRNSKKYTLAKANIERAFNSLFSYQRKRLIKMLEDCDTFPDLFEYAEKLSEERREWPDISKRED